MGELGFCTIPDILKQIQTQFIIDITTDSNMPISFMRILHNKLFYGLFFTLRCYFGYLDPFQVLRFTSPIILALVIYAIIEKRYRKIILITIFIMPVFFILNPLRINLEAKIMYYKYYFWIIAMIGLVKIIVRLFKSNLYSRK